MEEIYNEICEKLTDFESDTDTETTDEQWLEEFYYLLVKTKNTIEIINELQ